MYRTQAAEFLEIPSTAPRPAVAPVKWSTWKRRWLWAGPAMLLGIGAFDLALTVSAFEAGRLVEMNPIAAAVLAHGGSSALAVYRLVMTMAGCVLLRWGLHAYRLRR